MALRVLARFPCQLVPSAVCSTARSFASISAAPSLDEGCWSKRQRQSFGINEQDYPDVNTCMGAVAKHFPGALPGQIVDLVTQELLLSRGFTKDNTLFAHATCPDEINSDNVSDDLVVLLKRRWRGAFPLGGLAGLPFAGETGWAAFSAHVPEDGKIFLLFAPHVGVSNTGQVGYVGRRGQKCDSTACGAAIGALNAVKSGGKSTDNPYDYQMNFIIDRVAERIDEINAAENPIYAVTHALYDVQVDFLRHMVRTHQLKQQGQQLHPIAVLGGIQINTTEPTPDHFLPLMFEVHTPVDAYDSAESTDNWSIVDCLPSLTNNLPRMFGHADTEHL